MIVSSKGIINGIIADKYGKRGKDFIDSSVPSLSLPLTIRNAPEGTAVYAIILDDPDAIPVAGFSWIHWLAANITTGDLKENASQDNPQFIQGKNSWGLSCYGGMSPPNAPHKYNIHVYALSRFLPLENGFTKEELEDSMNSLILDSYTLSGVYAD